MARLPRPHWLICTLAMVACSPRAGDTPPDRAEATRRDSPATAPDLPEAPPEWRIVPGRSAGLVTAGISEADLRQRYGDGVVGSTRIQIGEGETMPGAVLFGGDSLRRAEIIWRDSVHRRQYESAEYSQVLGDRDYSSASAPMQRLDPKVAQIFMDFE